MIIKNGLIYTARQSFVPGHITIIDNKISNITHTLDYSDLSDSNDIIDATDCYVIPGFIDIHLHGCMGYDFCEGTEEAFNEICNYELSQGITGICPATMTLTTDKLQKIFDTAGNFTNSTGATIRGITMEGPFISEKKKGAQNSAHIIKPNIDLFNDMQKRCNGLIKQVAIAPETDDNFSFIRSVSNDVVCSIAHSDADYDTALAAFNAGATHVTHLYNGMNNCTHRNPGIPGAAYDNKDNVYVELICDGIHVSPTVIRMTFDLFGSDRICMISDSMEATGLDDGNYTLGDQPVTVTGNLATLYDGTIAGSVSSLYRCFRTAVCEMNIPLESAIASCTITPAKSLGIDKECGSLECGKVADILILDKALNLIKIIHNGKVI